MASITQALTHDGRTPNERLPTFARSATLCRGSESGATCIAEHNREQLMPTTQNQNRNRNGGGGRGFAGMDDEQQRKIAQKGGEAVSRDRQHMSEIGRKGGEASGNNRQAGNRQR